MEGESITPPPSHPCIAAAPNSCRSFEDITNRLTPQSIANSDADLFDIQKHVALRELQQLINRYNDCFRRLKETIADVDDLRQENLQLAAENLDLSILVEEKEVESSAAAATGFEFYSDVGSADREERGKKIGGEKEDLVSAGRSESASGSGSGSASDGVRSGALPKSISIRSSGFLAVKHPLFGGVNAGGTHRLRLPGSPGGEKEAEVEAYNQGMAKTELCNKWGDNGWCPYGGRCQFAHGIEELRPVIRHPRYKTQICRMLGAGGDCPYGHRCHFRHALPNTTRRR